MYEQHCVLGVNVFYLIMFGFSFAIGTSIYPLCSVGSIAAGFVEFCVIVTQLSGLSSVKTSMKMNVVRPLVEKPVCGTVGKNWFRGVV